MTAVRYFSLLGLIAALAAVAYAFVVQFSAAPPPAVPKQINGRTVKYQDRWNGCYYDMRRSAVQCTEN